MCIRGFEAGACLVVNTDTHTPGDMIDQEMALLVAAAVGYQTYRLKSGAITAEEGQRMPLEIGTAWAAELWVHLPQLLALGLVALFIAYFARQCRLPR